jgi:arylsulfatase A-like enzyme
VRDFWPALLLLFTGCQAPDGIPARARNVIIVVTDDQGQADLGCLGTPGIRTPRLDRMASEGARFTDFYAAQPVCSASRAAILTGCYPERIGITGALGPRSPIGIAERETTLAELLGEQGFSTALFGKWHLGDAFEHLPRRHGFQRFFGLPYSHDMWPRHPESPDAWGDLPFYDDDVVLGWNEDPARYTGEFSRRALAWMRAELEAQRPFFLMLAHPMPHVPLAVGAEFRGATGAGLYADVLAEIDAGVGALLDELERHGATRDTLVVFTSDNGPWLSYGDHAGSTGPLREGKGTTFEGGVRVPCLVRWPARVPAGRVVRAPVMAIDLLPTIAAATGTSVPELPIDGLDLAPLLSGESEQSPHEALFFSYGTNALEAVRAGRWKLHFPHGYRTLVGAPGHGGIPGRYDYGARIGLALFDLELDPGERQDVAREHPDVVARLSALADEHRHELGDSLSGVVGRANRPPGRR